MICQGPLAFCPAFSVDVVRDIMKTRMAGLSKVQGHKARGVNPKTTFRVCVQSLPVWNSESKSRRSAGGFETTTLHLGGPDSERLPHDPININ